MSDIGLAELIVEVLHDRGGSTNPDWSLGSGCAVREGLVLTAARNVGPGLLRVRWRGTHELEASISWCGDKGSLDLALLAVPRLTVQVPPLCYGVVDRRLTTPVKNCWTAGFPRFNEQPGYPTPSRLSARLDGEILATGQPGLDVLTLQVSCSPRPLPRRIAESEWAGMSGAAVFAGEVLVGAVTESHLPAGDGALAVVPVTAIQQRDDAAVWWQLLGADPAGLRCLPGRSDGWSEDTGPQNVRIMMHVLLELRLALTGLSRARSWTSARWMRESTGLQACLHTLESGLAALPAQCRPRLESDDQAFRLGMTCADISEPLQNVKTSLDFLNGKELSDGERARELNIFFQGSKELQRAISHLQEILTALYGPGQPHQETGSQPPQDAPSPPKAPSESASARPRTTTTEEPQARQTATVPAFSGEVKLKFCQRIGINWKDLADLFGIPPYERKQFSQGDEPRALWEWLETRSRLSEIPDKLTQIDRMDLAEIMQQSAP